VQRELLKTLFWISLLLMLATLGALIAIDLHLRNAVSPQGIVSFELCAYTSSCRAIVEAWGPGGQVWAALSLGVDYLFMFLYPATIFLGLTLAVVHVPERLSKFTRGAAWAVWGAGAADAAENYCLAQMLLNPSPGAYAWPAALFATIKFIVLGVTLGWLLAMYLRFARRSVRAA
jgi:FtsH-binding integral membrane protein